MKFGLFKKLVRFSGGQKSDPQGYLACGIPFDRFGLGIIKLYCSQSFQTLENGLSKGFKICDNFNGSIVIQK